VRRKRTHARTVTIRVPEILHAQLVAEHARMGLSLAEWTRSLWVQDLRESRKRKV
jgi:predicted HicB family RNase H-like nuclease